VLTVFDDRRPTPLLWTPAVLLGASAITDVLSQPLAGWIWVARNVFSGLLAVHAGVVITRGWSGDLLEGRRRLRTPVLGFAALFALAEVTLAFVLRLSHDSPLRASLSAGPTAGRSWRSSPSPSRRCSWARSLRCSASPGERPRSLTAAPRRLSG
jgi:hypothetical protein